MASWPNKWSPGPAERTAAYEVLRQPELASRADGLLSRHHEIEWGSPRDVAHLARVCTDKATGVREAVRAYRGVRPGTTSGWGQPWLAYEDSLDPLADALDALRGAAELQFATLTSTDQRGAK